MAKGCVTKQIRFKTKRGRTISFKGRHGPSCSPRRKRALPAALRPWTRAAKACARSGKKVGTRAMVSCMRAKAG